MRLVNVLRFSLQCLKRQKVLKNLRLRIVLINKLQKMADKIVEQFSDDQIDEFKEAFTLFDRNEDGTIFESQVIWQH